MNAMLSTAVAIPLHRVCPAAGQRRYVAPALPTFHHYWGTSPAESQHKLEQVQDAPRPGKPQSQAGFALQPPATASSCHRSSSEGI